MEATFWLLAAVLGWCYFGYPLAMIVRSRLRPDPVDASAESTPTVTVVLAVRDEAARIVARLENLCGSDYPADRLDVVVVCNGCGEQYARRHDRIRLVRSRSDGGKSQALNEGVAAATGEIIVFADARQRFESGTIGALVAPLADARVGAVTGRLVIRSSDRPAVRGVGLYWDFETELRQAEARTGSVVGVTGAVYAVRRALFPRMPAGLILDDLWVPMRIAQAGYRIGMAPAAVACDDASPGEAHEFTRRRRTMVGNIQLVRSAPDLLVPWRNPLWSRFVSHKLLRVASPFCFVALLVVSALLPGAYRVFFGLELGAYGLGLIGLIAPLPLLSLPAAFVLMHGAAFAALPHWGANADRVWVRPAARELEAGAVPGGGSQQ